MTLAARDSHRSRPQLRLVHGSFRPVTGPTEWQRVARAVVACTHELARHLLEQRWPRVDEVLRERRELIEGMERLPLDADGRRCLVSLQEAAAESERAVNAMMGRHAESQG
ncbi:MAG TPA: hypothetical protein VM146_12100 [Steroidobacteraceae bacterium]|nr:hypothetical protein [Steroidobacteraceae bacterium]